VVLLVACTHDPLPPHAAIDPAPSDPSREATLPVHGGTLHVDSAGVLRFEGASRHRVLDRSVVPELARSADGHLAAWPRRTVTGAELVVCAMPDGAPRVVSAGLAVADRPVFAPDGASLVFWGSGSGEALVGLYRASLAPGAAPVRMNNRGLRSPGDARFVAPPMAHDDARFVAATTLRYRGPDGEVTIDLARE
jgi:hypothetical protein